MDLQRIQVPSDIDAPWLTRSYISENAFHPVPNEKIPSSNFYLSPFGPIIARNADEVREGDVMIFDKFEEWNVTNMGYMTDRFRVVTEKDIEEYRAGMRDFSSIEGIVVHPPKSKEMAD